MASLDEDRRAQLRRAISDPGAFLPRIFGDGESAHEMLPSWQTRAVEKVIGPWLADPDAATVAQFQVHCDEDGDLSLACPRVDDLGCIFAAGRLSGTTLGELAEAARRHTGEAAEQAHDYIRKVNGDE